MQLTRVRIIPNRTDLRVLGNEILPAEFLIVDSSLPDKLAYPLPGNSQFFGELGWGYVILKHRGII